MYVYTYISARLELHLIFPLKHMHYANDNVKCLWETNRHEFAGAYTSCGGLKDDYR